MAVAYGCGLVAALTVPTQTAAAEAVPSPALTTMVHQALDNNPRVQAARAALDGAGAREDAASRPLYNPELELETEKTTVRTTTLGLSQSIDWHDKRSARAQAARFERAAIEATLAQARQQLAVQLLSALADYHKRRELDGLAQERHGLLQRFAALAQQRHAAGDLAQADLDLAQLAVAESALQRAEAAAALADARHALAALLGEVPPQWPALPHKPPPQVFAADPEAMLDRLPELVGYRARIAAAEARVRLAVRETRPDPTLRLRAGREDAETLTSLSVSVPLFVRNDFRAQTAASSAALTELEHQAQNARRMARARLFAAQERFRLSRAAWDQWQQTGHKTLAAHGELLQRLWRLGETNATNYLVQIKQALDTQAAAVGLRGRLWREWLEWLAASGRVNQWLGLQAAP